VAAHFTPDAVWWTPIAAHERGLVARPVEGSAEVAEMVTTVAGYLYDSDRT
jgi:hypothetical protein